MKEKNNKQTINRVKLSKPAIKSKLAFFKIDVGSKSSLKFFRDLFLCLGFKIGFENEQQINFRNEEMGILVYHGINVSGSGIYILNTGINNLFFRVSGKDEVDRFNKEFLKPRKISTTVNEEFCEEEGKYSIFFLAPEKMTIGIISG